MLYCFCFPFASFRPRHFFPDEKKADKSYRNINRRVSPSVFIGAITVDSK
ncbi:MAG: hypothetical protein IJ634_05295 [Bacteroidales bacterium]|nr:hypothetical protein [Bacteroidales bacterium]